MRTPASSAPCNAQAGCASTARRRGQPAPCGAPTVLFACNHLVNLVDPFFFIQDPTHMLKCLRNQLETSHHAKTHSNDADSGTKRVGNMFMKHGVPIDCQTGAR